MRGARNLANVPMTATSSSRLEVQLVPAVEQARARRRKYREQWGALRVAVRKLSLFGDGVVVAIESLAEPMWESGDETAARYEEAIADLERRLDQARTAGERVQAEKDRLLVALDAAVEVTKARHKKSRRPLPDWVQQATDLLDDEVPF